MCCLNGILSLKRNFSILGWGLGIWDDFLGSSAENLGSSVIFPDRFYRQKGDFCVVVFLLRVLFYLIDDWVEVWIGDIIEGLHGLLYSECWKNVTEWEVSLFLLLWSIQTKVICFENIKVVLSNSFPQSHYTFV